MFYEVFIMLPYLYEAIYKRAQDFNETKWYLSIQQPTATIYHFHIKQNHFHNKQQQFLAMINLNFIKNIEGATFIYKSNPYKNINMILVIQTPSLSNKLLPFRTNSFPFEQTFFPFEQTSFRTSLFSQCFDDRKKEREN